MKKMIEIRRWDNNVFIFSAEVASIKEAVELAVSKGVSLAYANLICADLESANLICADLRSADLKSANLICADLRSADLKNADLRSANLKNADLESANLICANLKNADLTCANLPHFSIVPEISPFKAYKKLSNDVVVEVTIPAKAKRTNSLIGRKCRASEVKVTKIIENPSNLPLDKDHSIASTHYGQPCYYLGAVVKADKWDDDIRIECTHGIHFFMTLREAQEWN